MGGTVLQPKERNADRNHRSQDQSGTYLEEISKASGSGEDTEWPVANFVPRGGGEPKIGFISNKLSAKRPWPPSNVGRRWRHRVGVQKCLVQLAGKLEKGDTELRAIVVSMKKCKERAARKESALPRAPDLHETA